ncbi:MAG TPA: hypothetical protein VFZ32_06965 [Micromonosporaceae bacterium]
MVERLPGPAMSDGHPDVGRREAPPGPASSPKRSRKSSKAKARGAEEPPGPRGQAPSTEKPQAGKPAGRSQKASRDRAGGSGVGGRSQVRAQLRQVARLRLLTLAFVTLVLLGSLPGFFLIKYATRDPGFRAMDTLEVPGWAARNPVDQAMGSRWCLRECRLRHRVWESQRAQQPTVEAYQRALRRDGWKRWEVPKCPPRKVRGDYTCWRRDAYTLDLWVRGPECRGDTDEEECPEAIVTMVIRNAGADARLQ